jgi:hypothetical protein
MTVTVTCTFSDSAQTAIGGRFVVRPVVPASVVLPDLGVVVVTKKGVWSVQDGGVCSASVIPSDSPDWLLGSPMPYRITEFAPGDTRTYIAFIDGPGPVDLADVRKYILTMGPPEPAPDRPRMKRLAEKRAKDYQHPTQNPENIYLSATYVDCSTAPESGEVLVRVMYTASDIIPRMQVVTRLNQRLTLDARGRFDCEVIPSDSEGWLTTEPVPYRITENLGGLKRSWCAYIGEDRTFDVALFREQLACTELVSVYL